MWQSSNIWETALRNENNDQEKIKGRIYSGNADTRQLRISCFYMYKCKNQNAQATILLVVLYRCKTRSLIFKKNLGSEFENRPRPVKGTFGRNGETVTTGSRNTHNELCHFALFPLPKAFTNRHQIRAAYINVYKGLAFNNQNWSDQLDEMVNKQVECRWHVLDSSGTKVSGSCEEDKGYS